MNTKGQFQIKRSKTKLNITFICILLFILLNLWIFIDPANYNGSLFKNIDYVRALSFIAAVIFSIWLFNVSKKLIDPTPGLSVNDKGIIDNSTDVNAGYVPWSDVLAIKVVNSMNQPFIVMMVQNPNDYLKKTDTGLKRKSMDIKFSTFGSPVCIPVNELQVTPKRLLELLQAKFTDYKNGE